MAQHKLPVRQRPIRNSVEHLHQLRARPEYYQGLLINEAAEAAFAVDMEMAAQSQRKRVSRHFSQLLHTEVAAHLEVRQNEATLEPIFANLSSALKSVVSVEV